MAMEILLYIRKKWKSDKKANIFCKKWIWHTVRLNGIKLLRVLLSLIYFHQAMGKNLRNSVNWMFFTFYCNQFSLVSAIGFDYLYSSYFGKSNHEIAYFFQNSWRLMKTFSWVSNLKKIIFQRKIST